MIAGKQRCRYCSEVTAFHCPECDALCCMACGVNLCPLCVRVKLLQIEHALRNRLVPWQHIEVSMLPTRSHLLYLIREQEDHTSSPMHR